MPKSMVITVTDNTEQALSLSSRLRRQAGIKPGDELEVRISGGIVSFIPRLPNADDEYTPEQRRIIDARLAKAEEDIEAGRVYGPFETIEELERSMRHTARKKPDKAKPSPSGR